MKSGVYRILNVKTGDCYVGGTQDIHVRWGAHVGLLRRNLHHSKKLQAAWNEYGLESFKLEVLERVPLNLLADREQAWLDSLRPLYNILQFSKTVKGMRHTEESRKKMSIAKTGLKQSPETIRKRTSWMKGRKVSPETIAKLRGRKRSEETRRKMSIARIGTTPSAETRIKLGNIRRGKKLTPEQKERLKLRQDKLTEAQKQNVIRTTIQTHSKHYIVTAPDGSTCKVFNISDFSRRNGLGNGAGLARVARGERPHHRGWKCVFDNEAAKQGVA